MGSRLVSCSCPFEFEEAPNTSLRRSPTDPENSSYRETVAMQQFKCQQPSQDQPNYSLCALCVLGGEVFWTLDGYCFLNLKVSGLCASVPLTMASSVPSAFSV